MAEENEIDLDYLLALRDKGYRFFTNRVPGYPETWYFIDQLNRKSVLFDSFQTMMKALRGELK